jgi:16S rRNA (adenine1518-N6/adenine1519-N6)-dimethyltransferase
MQTLTQIKELLASRGLAPRKSLGQNFLVDHNLIRRLVDAAGVCAGDPVLEIGPGTGTMTEELLARGCRVVACELDRGLAAMLRERLSDAGAAFTLIEGDCLASKHELNPEVVAALTSGPFTLVSNLPYGAATPVMSTLLADHPACGGLYVTIQREVADRLAAGPGSKDYGALTVLAQTVAEISGVAKLPPECFWPRPDVTSAMVGLRRRPVPLAPSPRSLDEFCRRLFEQRRKQIGSVLGRSFFWPPGITPEQRAEQLSVQQLIALHTAARAADGANAAGSGIGPGSG